MISYQISDTVIRVEAQRKWVSENRKFSGPEDSVCLPCRRNSIEASVSIAERLTKKRKWGQREGQKANHKQLDWQQGGLKSLLEIKLALLESFEQRNNVILPIF